MEQVSISEVVEQLLAVLEEACEHTPKAWTYFTDNKPDSGLFDTLAGLSAADASRPSGGTSIAAHVNHVLFGMNASAAWIQGDQTPRDWSQSWRVSTVDDATWITLIEHLRVGYTELRQAVQTDAAASAMTIGASIGAVAHIAYHLGAIRQKLAHLAPSKN